MHIQVVVIHALSHASVVKDFVSLTVVSADFAANFARALLELNRSLLNTKLVEIALTCCALPVTGVDLNELVAAYFRPQSFQSLKMPGLVLPVDLPERQQVKLDSVLGEVVRLALMAVKLLNVHVLSLPRKVHVIRPKHDHVYQDNAVDEHSAKQTEPGVEARFAIEVHLYFVTVYVAIKCKFCQPLKILHILYN